MAEAFAAAAEALMSVIVDTTRAGEDLPRMVALEAGDYEQLLVRWLSEVLWHYDGGNFVSKRFVISDISPTALRATLLGEMFDTGKHPPRLDVKAVTYHQVRAEEAGGRAVVRVYLDI